MVKPTTKSYMTEQPVAFVMVIEYGPGTRWSGLPVESPLLHAKVNGGCPDIRLRTMLPSAEVGPVASWQNEKLLGGVGNPGFFLFELRLVDFFFIQKIGSFG